MLINQPINVQSLGSGLVTKHSDNEFLNSLKL